MTTWRRVTGDVDDTIVATIDEIDMNAVTTVSAYVWHGIGPAVLLEAAVTSIPLRQVTAQLSPWLETAMTGWWAVEFEFHFGSGQTITWPARKPDRIFVRSQGVLATT